MIRHVQRHPLGQPAQDGSGRYRSWGPCTLNNPFGDLVPRREGLQRSLEVLVDEITTAVGGVSFFVGQLEEGKQDHTLHLQFGFHRENPISFGGLRRRFSALGLHPHLEISREFHDVEVYCQKEDTRVPDTSPIIRGEPPRQGRRSDLHAVAARITAGDDFKDIVMSDPGTYVRYHHGMEKLHAMIRVNARRERTRGICFFGPTGSGKSLKAVQFALQLAGGDESQVYHKSNPNAGGAQWWNNYTGQRVVLWDDFDHTHTSKIYILRLLDHSPFMVEPKGGQVQFSSKYVLFTHLQHPRFWYGGGEDRELVRRFKSVRNFATAPHFFDGPPSDTELDCSDLEDPFQDQAFIEREHRIQRMVQEVHRDRQDAREERRAIMRRHDAEPILLQVGDNDDEDGDDEIELD